MRPVFKGLAFLAAILAACFCACSCGTIGCHATIDTGMYRTRITSRAYSFGIFSCALTVRPKDDNHVIRLRGTSLRCKPLSQPPCSRHLGCRPLQLPPYCQVQLIIATNASISKRDFERFATQLYSNNSKDLSNFGNPVNLTLYHRGWLTQSHQTSFTLGPFEMIVGAGYYKEMEIDFNFEHIPIVHPGSRDLCPKPKMLSTNHQVPETHTGRRLVLNQVMVKSDGDCRTSVLFVLPTGQTSSSRGNKLMVSVNCTRTSGSLTVVADEAVSSVTCNSVGTQLSLTQQNEPITVVSEGTGGFTAKLDQLMWIPDGSFHCPKYNPTSHKPWIANLPLVIGSSTHEDIFYCLFTLSPPPGHDLMIQVHLSFTDNLMEQFCKLLSIGPYLQPHLSFIKSAPNSSDYEVRLCHHQMARGLLMQNRIRVVSGGSLTVDLIATQLHPQLRNQANSIGSSLRSSGMDAVIVVHQVDSCPSPSHFNSWKLSPDRSQILNTLTVVPGNSQTNCNLQVNAASAVRIANDKRLHKPTVASPACWILRVMLHKFDTTCGLHQLMLTVSYWDSVAESIVHKQMEVCGNGNFTWNVTLLMPADKDTGMSLWYSGVRSGFDAQFSLTACENSVQSVMETRTGVLVSNGDTDSYVPITIFVLLLAFGNLCVILFAVRSPMLSIWSSFINWTLAGDRFSANKGDDDVVAMVDG